LRLLGKERAWLKRCHQVAGYIAYEAAGFAWWVVPAHAMLDSSAPSLAMDEAAHDARQTIVK